MKRKFGCEVSSKVISISKQKYLIEDSYPSKKYSSLNPVRWILFCFVLFSQQFKYDVMRLCPLVCALFEPSQKKSSLGVKYIKSLTI